MTYELFKRLTGAEISEAFYSDVIEPMFLHTPHTVDKETFCRMFNKHGLKVAEKRWQSA